MRTLTLPISLLFCALAGAQTPSHAVDPATNATVDGSADPSDEGADPAGSSAAGAAGQNVAAPVAPANAPIKLGPITFSGTIRNRLYAWDWFKPVKGDNQYEFYGTIARLNFAERLKSWDWDAEFAIPIFLGLPTGATDPAPQGALGLGSNFYTNNKSNRNTAFIYPKQLYVRMDEIGGDEGQSLQLGRFVFYDGTETVPKNATLAWVKSARLAQRLLGDFGFAEPGRAFDGVHYAFSRPSDNLTFVAAIPTRGVFQVDGWGWNQVGFGYLAYTHEWGHGKHSADSRLFVLEYDDWRDNVLKTDNRPAGVRAGDTENIRIDTYGGHTIHAFETSAGPIDLLGWGAIQTGRWGTQRHRAFAILFEGGWQPKVLPKVKPWLRVGYRMGSGDSNPNDKTHSTFFEVEDTPRLYARTPFFNTMNMEDLYGSFILRPGPKITISSEFHSLRLANGNDLWYVGGGAYQPWSFGFTGRAVDGRRSLANFYDINFEYRANRHLTLTPYFGYMQGLAAIENIYPADKDGRFGIMELTYRF